MRFGGLCAGRRAAEYERQHREMMELTFWNGTLVDKANRNGRRHAVFLRLSSDRNFITVRAHVFALCVRASPRWVILIYVYDLGVCSLVCSGAIFRVRWRRRARSPCLRWPVWCPARYGPAVVALAFAAMEMPTCCRGGWVVCFKSTDTFRKQQIPATEHDIKRSLSLIASGRTLDLIFATPELCQLWLQGFQALIPTSGPA